MIERLKDLWDIIKKNKKNTVAVVAVILLLVAFWNSNYRNKQTTTQKDKIEQTETETNTNPSVEYVEGTDAYLMSMQEELRKNYGTPPKGFIWDISGELISLGDKSMSSEDVLYSYVRALSTLDFSIAEKYSRGASVVNTFSEYLSAQNAKQSDYQEAFLRNMYRVALTSLEVEEVESSAKFAKNKVSYTVRMNMLDLTSKDFWEKDKESLFRELDNFDYKENDSTKLDIFLYDYILKYYKSEDATKREVTFDITLERYPDIDSGWLVSIDKDIDDAAKYTDGTLVTTYIKEKYRDWAINERLSNKSSSSASTSNSTSVTKESYPLTNED